MTIRAKLLIGAAASLVASIALGLVIFVTNGQADQATDRAFASNSMLEQLVRMNAVTIDLLARQDVTAGDAHGSERAVTQWYSSYDELAALLQIDELRPSGAEDAILTDIQDDLTAVAATFAQVVALGDDLPAGESELVRQGLAERLTAQLSLQSQLLSAGIHDLNDTAHEEVSSVEHRRNVLVLSLAGMLIVTLVGTGLAVLLSVARPVAALTRAAEAISGGDLACRVDATSRDEVGILGRMFNRMAERLEKRADELVRANATLRKEVAQRKQAEDALRERARRDPLTGVLNHAAIIEELANVIGGAGDSASGAVAMVDVDGLKVVNDTYGHPTGDAVLVTVARALSRERAIVGRYGGDEFVTILRDADRTAGEQYRDAVLASLTKASLTDPETGTSVPVVASIGLAIFPKEAETIDELIRASDRAMYHAKRQRPPGVGALTSLPELGAERAATLVGQLVPLLTAPGDVNSKLQHVSQHLSTGAGYDGVNVSVFASPHGEPPANNTFAEVPQELVDAWNSDQRTEAENHPIRPVLERAAHPLIIEDPWNSELLWESQRSLLRAADLKSVLVAPLVWEDRVVGSLGVAAKREHAFGATDAQFLGAVASQVTAIIRMAAMVDQLEEGSSRLIEAQEETVLLLAAAAEAHDHTTGRHLQNIRSLTELLARELGYSEERVTEVGLAAVLHDIGKIRVPEGVLNSPERLAEADWDLMKHHTVWGAEFLAGHRGFELAAIVARFHHERWDGDGYPDRLRGEDIPEAATTVAVADAFDAMSNNRPYRRARSAGACIREIVACSGSQFSPKVVEALVRLNAQEKLTALHGHAPPRAAAA